MTSLLVAIPIFALLSAIILNARNGRREIIRLDMVQFFYAFVMAPLLFLWAKTFIYVLLRTEVAVRLSALQLFIYDTIFSLFFLYIFAFVVIHSLTKSMKLQSLKDPLYDIFHHAEYFHLWLSHFVVYTGALGIISLLSALNVFFPLMVGDSRVLFYGTCVLGVVTGLLIFLGIWLYDPTKGRAQFMRVMKLMFGLNFALQVILFFVFDPEFSTQFGLFWWGLFAFAAMVAISFFADRSTRAQSLIQRILNRFQQREWKLP